MAAQLEEPIFLVLQAQRDNIARIATALELPGTTASGENVLLWGPQPNVIRLYDTPLRFVQDSKMGSWERIVTLYPVSEEEGARITSRVDKTIAYHIQFLIRLLESEVTTDREQVLADAVRTNNPLAQKVHRFLYDFHHVFRDDIQLETVACPQGLVDDSSYRLVWNDVEYPQVVITAEVSATFIGW